MVMLPEPTTMSAVLLLSSGSVCMTTLPAVTVKVLLMVTVPPSLAGKVVAGLTRALRRLTGQVQATAQRQLLAAPARPR